MTLLIFLLGFLLGPQQIAARQAPPSRRIAGIVVNAITGAPVAHAEVSISLDEGQASTRTHDDGRFVFEGLEAGKKYPLFATAPGYVGEGYNQHWAYATAIAVGDGLDSENIVFRLHPQAVIYGVVRDDNGEPVRAAQVMLLGIQTGNGKRAPSMQGQIQTNDLGEYRFAHLFPGKYFVAVQAQPWYAHTGLIYSSDNTKPISDIDVVYPVTLYPGVTDEHSARELILAAGQKEEADIQLNPVPAVHVRVTSAPGDETTGFGIGAKQQLFGSFDVGLSVLLGKTSPGEYEVAGLPPGKVTLMLNQQENEGWSTRTIDANLGAGDTLDATTTAAAVNVSGRVIFPAGDPGSVPGQVMLDTQGNRDISARLQKDGTFSFAPAQIGTYKVSVNVPDRAEYVQRITALGAKTFGREVMIESATDVQLTITMGRGPGQVTGVAKLNGKPTAGVMVLLMPESGENLDEDIRMDQSDSDGTFALSNIVPGKYVLMAIEDGWDLEWMNVDVLKPYREKGQTIQIAPNQTEKVSVEVQNAIKRVSRKYPITTSLVLAVSVSASGLPTFPAPLHRLAGHRLSPAR
jgi:hypothetical protein